jgi:hypothetical protein
MISFVFVVDMLLKHTLNAYRVCVCSRETSHKLALHFGESKHIFFVHHRFLFHFMDFLPAVLVPSFHLSVGQSEFGGQFKSVLYAEVFLTFETLLQCLQLMVGERRSSFPRLLAHARRRLITRAVAAFAGRAPAVIVTVTATTSSAAVVALVAIFIVVFS